MTTVNDQTHIVTAISNEITTWLRSLPDQGISNVAAALGMAAEHRMDDRAEAPYQWGANTYTFMDLAGQNERPDVDAVRTLVQREIRRRYVVRRYNKLAAKWGEIALNLETLNAPTALIAVVQQWGADLAQDEDAEPADPFKAYTLKGW